MAAKIKRFVILIDGPDAEQALSELLTNAEYDKLNVAIWLSDNPNKPEIGSSTLAYAPLDETKPGDKAIKAGFIKH